ncbi:MAG: hypothetical protein JWN76_2205 [Chitinophagaceae bacterium]|nr:hypothetical protein [Chitinophagaceae bacterium]
MFHYLVLILLWLVFCLLHSVLALPGLKDFVKNCAPKLFPHYRLLYNIFAFVNLGILLWYQYSFTSEYLLTSSQVVKIVAGIILTVGGTIMCYCIYQYFPVLSGLKKIENNKTLIITGPNKFVRHPLYFGTLIFIYGLFLFFPSISNLIAITAVTIYVMIGIEYEEKKLNKEFGEDYRAYSSKVKKLFPGIY